MTQPRLISKFGGAFRFLSNFYIEPDGSCVEKEYQASKAISQQDRDKILGAPTPGEAKRLGRSVPIRSDWESVKLDMMYKLVLAKFHQEPLKTWLLATDNAVLQEGNNWGDTFWGVCAGKGENHLGKILMRIRSEVA